VRSFLGYRYGTNGLPDWHYCAFLHLLLRSCVFDDEIEEQEDKEYPI
jgi:hypothetical protein